MAMNLTLRPADGEVFPLVKVLLAFASPERYPPWSPQEHDPRRPVGAPLRTGGLNPPLGSWTMSDEDTGFYLSVEVAKDCLKVRVNYIRNRMWGVQAALEIARLSGEFGLPRFDLNGETYANLSSDDMIDKIADEWALDNEDAIPGSMEALRQGTRTQGPAFAADSGLLDAVWCWNFYRGEITEAIPGNVSSVRFSTRDPSKLKADELVTFMANTTNVVTETDYVVVIRRTEAEFVAGINEGPDTIRCVPWAVIAPMLERRDEVSEQTGEFFVIPEGAFPKIVEAAWAVPEVELQMLSFERIFDEDLLDPTRVGGTRTHSRIIEVPKAN